MHRTYNTAILLIRTIGVICVALGLMWLVNLALATFLTFIRVPDWLLNPIWGYTAQGLLSGPIWFFAGVVLLRNSERLASYIAKGAKDDAVQERVGAQEARRG